MTPFKASLIRIGLGFATIGAAAIGLWPVAPATFDIEKAFGFCAALVVWVFAEFYTEGKAQSDGAQLQGVPEHDRVLAKKLFAIASDDHIEFLKQHDFGASWRKEWLDPAYELAHELTKVTSEFEDADLEAQRLKLKDLASKFAGHMSMNAGPIMGVELFSMIPERERNTEQWSDRTKERIVVANETADQVAAALEGLYRLSRRKGIVLHDPA